MRILCIERWTFRAVPSRAVDRPAGANDSGSSGKVAEIIKEAAMAASLEML